MKIAYSQQIVCSDVKFTFYFHPFYKQKFSGVTLITFDDGVKKFSGWQEIWKGLKGAYT